MKIDGKSAAIFGGVAAAYVGRAIYLACTSTDSTMIIIYFVLATITTLYGCVDQLITNISRLNDKIYKLENDIKKLSENSK